MTVDRASATDDLVSAAELDGLRDRLEGELPAFLADLERLCSIDCGSYTPAGVNRVADWVAAFLAKAGASVERRPDPGGRYGDTIIGTFEGEPDTGGRPGQDTDGRPGQDTDGRPGEDAGGGPNPATGAQPGHAVGSRLLLIGHMDTVFDEGTVAARPFRIDDGIARGPGVTDMKGGLLAGLYAVRAIVEASRGAVRADGPSTAFPLERLVFVANPDEEIGSPSSTPHIREIAAASDACLVLECARANGDFVSARKGIVDLRVTIHGRAAHAGVEPEKGRSAIVAGANLVPRIQALNGRWPDVTANVGVFVSGTRPNVIPDLAELQVDVRGMTRRSLEAAVAAVREVVAAPGVPDVTTEVETMASWLPMEKLERSGRLVEHAIRLAARLGFATKDAATGGASDANTTSGMGVPSIDGLGPVGGLDHSPDEYLEVASIVPRTALVAALILAVGRDPILAGWRSAQPAHARGEAAG